MNRTAPSPAFGLVGRSPEIGAVRRLIEKASRNRLPVLLLGESGTGKEVVARAIYHANPSGQLVPIDCGSLVGTLVESDLFGHVKGAFSGAVENKKGLVEVAAGGTAFFDEIGDLPLEMQVKLLRLLQEREFRAVGALQWRKIDLRIIAATHRTLRAEVAAGRFREDLFYRLHVFIIHLPPLRDRKEDIPLLVEHILRDINVKHGRQVRGVNPEVIEMFASYSWPGNVRELRNVLERAAIMANRDLIGRANLPAEFGHTPAAAASDLSALRFPVGTTVEAVERELILQTLASTSNKTRAAELLGISLKTLHNKLKEYEAAKAPSQ